MDVAELVGDDEPHLARRELLQQVVVEHDALGAPDPGHVGVGGRGAARGVHHVDLADVDARLSRQRQHGRAGLAVGQRRELVEQRVEHDRRQVGRDDAEADHHGGRGRPPPAAEAAHAEDQQRAACARQQGADRRALGHIGGVADPRLGHQADILGALARGDAHRQRDQRQRDRQRRGGRRARQDLAPARPQQDARRLGHDEGEHPQLDHHPGAEQPQLPGAIGLGLLDLRRAEVGSRRDVEGLDQTTRPHEQHRSFRHHQRSHDGDGKAEPHRHRIDDTPPCRSPSQPTSTGTATRSRP